MKKYLLASLAVLALSVAACSDYHEPELTIAQNSLTYEATGGSQSVDVMSNKIWRVATDGQTWYTVSTTEGNCDETLTVTVDPYTDAAGRSGQITITSHDLIQTIAVIQKRPVVPDDPTQLAYSIRNYEQDFSIPAPQGFTYQVVVPDGVTVVSQDENTIVLHFPENTSEDYIDYVVKVQTTDGLDLETATFTQSWKAIEAGELVIDEIFFAGNLIAGSSSSDGSDGDQYIKLTNTSSETIYADGVIFALSETDSQVSSTGAYWAYPELPESIGVNTIYQIPGTGKDVAIEAGQSIVLALSAQNFKAENENGCDLSTADFEFYDENDWYPDTDNPDVTNLTNWFKSSWSITSLHDRGYESYAIALPPAGMTAETFMETYPWVGKRVMDWNGYHFERDIADAYTIPNSWVLDAVNCAVVENLGTLAFNATVDAGYTNVSTVDKDPERYGKSVIRKRSEGAIMDTNNSTNDFEVNLNPTMK